MIPPHEVLVNDQPLDPAPSLALRNHSPTGFSWGYHGSGPAQLALAILLNEYGSEIALSHYQAFKREVVAAHSANSTWYVDTADLALWLPIPKNIF